MRVINLGGCWALFSVCIAIMIEHHMLFSMLSIFVFDRFFDDRALFQDFFGTAVDVQFHTVHIAFSTERTSGRTFKSRFDTINDRL